MVDLVVDRLLNYKLYGENSHDDSHKQAIPIVFLHGMLGELQNWNSQAKRFADQGYKVLAVDLRNHGGSPHLKGMSYRQMAEDVLALLSHLEFSKINLSGHSMGGKVGMYLALLYPEIIQKLVVVDIAPVAYPLWHQQIFHALLSLPIDQLNSRREADKLLAKSIDDDFERAFLLKNLKRKEEKYELHSGNQYNGYQWKCDLAEISRNYLKIVGFPAQNTKFPGDVLFIKGENSEYITEEYTSRILQYFPQAKIETIANAGHLPHVQQPDIFYEQASHFL